MALLITGCADYRKTDPMCGKCVDKSNDYNNEPKNVCFVCKPFGFSRANEKKYKPHFGMLLHTEEKKKHRVLGNYQYLQKKRKAQLGAEVSKSMS